MKYEQKADESATGAEAEQEGESFKKWLMSLIAERNKKLKHLVIPPNAAMVCTLGCGIIFEGSEKCPRCDHQGLPYREFEAMVFEDLVTDLSPYPVSIRGNDFSLVIDQESAMVCTRLGCGVIFKGSEKCLLCGHQAETFSKIKARVYEVIVAGIEPDPLSKRKVLTRRIQ